nr:MAG TPA: hypothetical protein [Caudoviricetes sp.]
MQTKQNKVNKLLRNEFSFIYIYIYFLSCIL